MSLAQRKAIACYGVENYLRKNNFKVTRKTVADITGLFLKSKGIQYVRHSYNYKGLNGADMCNSYLVQDYWGEFVEFLKTQDLSKYKLQ